MRFAKIKNRKVVDVIQGLAPPDYIQVIKEWASPTEYPGDFYTTNSKEPIVFMKDGAPHENWKFELKKIEQIKDTIFDLQRKIRYKNQLGSFITSGILVTLIDRDDIKNIRALDLSLDDPYKVKSNVWIEGKNRDQLVIDANAHLTNAFKTERDGNSTVNAMTTIDELKVYFDSM